MRWWSLQTPRSTGIATAILGVLLAVLAVLQYRWIGEVSRAERQRLKAGLKSAADRFADELGREVTRVFFAFQPVTDPGGAEQSAAERWRHWDETSPQPGLVASVWVAEWQGEDLALARVDPQTEASVPVAWPAELLPVRRRILDRSDRPGRFFPYPIESSVPAILVPLHHRFPGEPERPSVVIVALDRAFLANELFPELAERFFNVSRSQDYLVAVSGPDGMVYRSDPSLPESRYRPGDVAMPLLAAHRGDLRRLDRRRNGGWPGEGPPPRRRDAPPPPRRDVPPPPRRDGPPPRLESEEGPPPPEEAGPPPGAPPRERPAPPAEQEAGPPQSAWQVVVTHREGSLEAVVEHVRWRNLAVSLAVLLLLAATLAVLAASAQQARRLARQQIEFVAGVTHELNTPLAAVRSAGQNLADGVVSDPAQVKRYGVLIEREGRRLSGMVAKVLELAGIQSGNKTYRPEPVSVADVIDAALADTRWVLEEKGMTVERDVPPDLPPVLADRGALRMAVQNLLDNAVKYAGEARWVGLRARADRDGREVRVIVEDRGPGIRPEDRPHLFEPFYRGRDVAGGAIHGSGLGLSLVRHAVEANRGTLSVATGPGGSAFTIRLPAAPRRAAVAGALLEEQG